MEKPSFTRANLPNVRLIMMIMCIPVEELLCQTVTGRIPVLKFLLSGVCGRLWPRPVVSGIKCYCFPGTWLLWCLPGTKTPSDVTTEGACTY
jgi:hypothetical protein